MDDARIVGLTEASYRNITAHALETFPDECCGLVVHREGRQTVVRVTNVQDQRHADDPRRFPRPAAAAYIMGPEVVPQLVGHERGDLVVEAFYHSHPNHDAYFSAEDRKHAIPWGEPAYPEAAHIVLSVFDNRVSAVKAFRWSQSARDFIETRLEVL